MTTDTMTMDEHGKNLRLGRFSETGRSYILTTVTKNRAPLFHDFTSARLLIRTMMDLEQKGFIASHAFVVMPDHLHWFVELKEKTLSVIMNQLKGSSSRRIQQYRGVTGHLWQPGFHDHALRRDEDHIAVGRYIVGNPVRAGLVKRAMDYPHWDSIWYQP